MTRSHIIANVGGSCRTKQRVRRSHGRCVGYISSGIQRELSIHLYRQHWTQLVHKTCQPLPCEPTKYDFEHERID